METLYPATRLPSPWRSPRDPLLAGGATPSAGLGHGEPEAGRFLTTPAQAAEREAHRELADAVQQEALVLHAQPIAGSADGRVAGYEMLVRWQHPRRGLLLPAAFIPLAEASGLIVDIDRWVVGRAVRCLREWRKRGYKGWLAVNVSVRSLEDGLFVADLRRTIEASPELRGRLLLEWTETAEARRPSAVWAALGGLRAAGAKVAIDDFGAGYTSYAQLVAQPFDVLKIDRSLLTAIDRDPGAQVVVRSVLRLARRLGATVVAEGVENEAQRAWLAAEGGVLAQGYVLGGPEPVPEESVRPPGRAAERSRSRSRRTTMSRRASFVFGLTAAVLIGAHLVVGQAASPPDSAPPSASTGSASGLSEVMVTDTGGNRLVGYGVVVDGQLTLKLGSSGDQIVLALVAPDGTVETMQAVRGADGGLMVELTDGSHMPFQAFLQQQGIGLQVEDANAADVAAGAPGKSGAAPGRTGSPGKSGGTPGRSGSSSSSGSHGH